MSNQYVEDLKNSLHNSREKTLFNIYYIVLEILDVQKVIKTDA